MKSIITLLLLLPVFAIGQFRVTIILDKIPTQPAAERIYITGNFNEWNPAHPEAMLTKNAQGKFTKIFEAVDAGIYDFKFTLGTAESTECKSDGTELSNRKATIQSDTVFHFTVARWKSAKNFKDSDKNPKVLLQLNTTKIDGIKPKEQALVKQ